VDIGPPELLIVLLVALIVLGPSQLPKLSRSIGQGIHEFRKSQHPESEEPQDGGPEAGS
jgi:sec-independent protein translocase protein TatA